MSAYRKWLCNGWKTESVPLWKSRKTVSRRFTDQGHTWSFGMSLAILKSNGCGASTKCKIKNLRIARFKHDLYRRFTKNFWRNILIDNITKRVKFTVLTSSEISGTQHRRKIRWHLQADRSREKRYLSRSTAWNVIRVFFSNLSVCFRLLYLLLYNVRKSIYNLI